MTKKPRSGFLSKPLLGSLSLSSPTHTTKKLEREHFLKLGAAWFPFNWIPLRSFFNQGAEYQRRPTSYSTNWDNHDRVASKFRAFEHSPTWPDSRIDRQPHWCRCYLRQHRFLRLPCLELLQRALVPSGSQPRQEFL